ncbi:MAG: sugar phosphate isomerase/epimerase [Anaerolineae bacterium]|nr:sugar phosphate isomerase/epimerase [Anaerolineae bacterium]
MSPDRWVAALKQAGYSAAYCPVAADTTPDALNAYVKAARKANILIAEVGAWSNPLDPDEKTRKVAMDKCKTQLALAEAIGARCCVNISGSRGEPWDGPHPDNLTQETFEMIVETVQEIIDAVNPRRTYYTLEPMPWMYPDSADNYLSLIKAINRPQFGVHIDIVNVINSPQRYFNNATLINEWFSKLGPYVRSCHAKDTLLSTHLTTHLDEVRPGLGALSYPTLLTELNKLDPDTPLMIEHLEMEEEYRFAAEYIRGIATDLGLTFL